MVTPETPLAFSKILLKELSPQEHLVPSGAKYIKSSRSDETSGKVIYKVEFSIDHPQPPITQFVDGRSFLVKRHTRCIYTNVVTYNYSMLAGDEMLTFRSIDSKPGKVTLYSSPAEEMSRIVDRLDG